jgi:hypothetical protein
MVSHQYLAGFFDGEGCVYINPSGRVQLSLTQKKREVLDLVQSEFGGKVKIKDRSMIPGWVISSKEDCLKFINAIYPYIIVKKEEVELGLKAIGIIRSENSGCNPLTLCEFNERMEMRKEMQRIRPSKNFGHLLSDKKRKRDAIKKECDYKCQLCGVDLKEVSIKHQIIADGKLICRACNMSRFDWTQRQISKEEVVNACNGRSIYGAAKFLGVARSTLYHKRMEYGLEKKRVQKLNPTGPKGW